MGGRIAIGVSAHTGWAALVALSAELEVVGRQRVQLGDDQTRFVYHVAAELPLAKARTLVDKTVQLGRERAREALAKWVAELGAAPAAMGIVEAKRTLDAELETILASHSLIHSAEGALWREVWATAARGRRMRVHGVPAPELAPRAAAALGLAAARMTGWLAELGKRAGRPWSLDQRQATLAAAVALRT